MDNYLSRTHTSVSKGLAILLIVFCHVCAAVLPASVARLTTPLGGTAVAVFLFLSGYGLSESCKKNNLDRYWSKKIRNVLIPYLAVFLIYVIVMCRELTLTDGILLLLTAKDRTDYYFWYVGYQFLWYGLFYLAMKLPGRGRAKYGVLLIGAAAGFLLFNELRAEQSLSFLLGVLASDHPAVKKTLNRRSTFLIMLCVGVGMLAVKQLPVVRAANALIMKTVQLSIKLSLAICLMQIACFVDRIGCLAKWGRFLGKYAYEIYLAHAISMLALLYCGNRWVGMALFAVLTVTISYLLAGFRIKLKPKKQ